MVSATSSSVYVSTQISLLGGFCSRLYKTIHDLFWYLAITIGAEVIATSALKASNGFSNSNSNSNSTSSTICIIGYAIACYSLSLVLKTVPVGIAYAIWAGMGIILIASISAVLYKQIPDLPAIIGMVLILAGVVVIIVFSETVSH